MTPTCSKKHALSFPFPNSISFMIHISNVASDFQCYKIRRFASNLLRATVCKSYLSSPVSGATTPNNVIGSDLIVLLYTSERWPNSRFQKWLSLWHVKSWWLSVPSAAEHFGPKMISLERISTTYFGKNWNLWTTLNCIRPKHVFI